MGVARNVLRTLYFGSDTRESVVIECRRCGRTLDQDDDPCPTCGADDVARFSI